MDSGLLLLLTFAAFDWGMAMTCRETIRLICEYLEGRLSPPVAASMQRHLAQCKNCHLVLEAAERTLEVYFDRAEDPELHKTIQVA